MAHQMYRTPRMVLRKPSAEEEVRQFAESNSWTLVSDRPGDAEAGQRRELVWEAGPEAQVTYSQDDMSPSSFVTASSASANLTSSLGRWLEEELRPWRVKDLSRLVDVAKDPVRIGLAVLRLGLGAPYEYDEAVFQRMSRGLTHEDGRTRDMAIWATTYSPWPQYRPLLRYIAEHDPEPDLRERARFTLDSYDAVGVPKS